MYNTVIEQLIIAYVIFIIMKISRENARLRLKLAVWTDFPKVTRSGHLTSGLIKWAIACLIALSLMVLTGGVAYAQASLSSPDVFGSQALPIARTPMDQKWQAVRNGRIPSGDASLGQMISRTRALSREDQVAAVNSWVNHRLAYVSDQALYGQSDRWSSASQSLSSGRGDCEDFAIAKYQILRELGVAEQDIYLVIGRDRAVRADHAVLAVRVSGSFRIMDNVTDRILGDDELTDFLPTFSFSSARSWLHGLPVN